MTGSAVHAVDISAGRLDQRADSAERANWRCGLEPVEEVERD